MLFIEGEQQMSPELLLANFAFSGNGGAVWKVEKYRTEYS
jgi:hypothetical protein